MSSIGKRQMSCGAEGCKEVDLGFFHQHWNEEFGKSVCRKHARLTYLEGGIDTVLLKHGTPGINFKKDSLDLEAMDCGEAEAIGRYTAKQGYLRAKIPFRLKHLKVAWVRGFGGDV